MASTNQSPHYKKAEQMFLSSETPKDKIFWLEEMIKQCPKHKSSEKMLANLKTRYKKIKTQISKSSKAGKPSKQGIKKQDMQCILTGMPNTGKTSIFNTLTKQKEKTSPIAFTTYQPKLGTINFEDVKIQIIDMPPFPSQDQGLLNSTDTLLVIIDNINQLAQTEKFTAKSKAKKIFIYNKADILSEKEKRKITSTLKSKKLDFILFSAVNPQNIFELNKKIFKSFPIIRIYTKEPHKPATKDPMILKQGSSVGNVAEKILKGMSKKIKKVKIWGPSSKFAGQPVGLEHTLKDKDTIEFQSK